MASMFRRALPRLSRMDEPVRYPSQSINRRWMANDNLIAGSPLIIISHHILALQRSFPLPIHREY